MKTFTEQQVHEILNRVGSFNPDAQQADFPDVEAIIGEVYAHGESFSDWQDGEDLKALRAVFTDQMKENGTDQFLGPALYAISCKVQSRMAYDAARHLFRRGGDRHDVEELYRFLMAKTPQSILETPDAPPDLKAFWKSLPARMG